MKTKVTKPAVYRVCFSSSQQPGARALQASDHKTLDAAKKKLAKVVRLGGCGHIVAPAIRAEGAKARRRERLLAQADSERDLARGALTYDEDGWLSAADQQAAHDEHMAKASALTQQANNLGAPVATYIGNHAIKLNRVVQLPGGGGLAGDYILRTMPPSLIAAAPDLYESCQYVAYAADVAGQSCNMDDDAVYAVAMTGRAIKDLRAAIAKAERGE